MSTQLAWIVGGLVGLLVGSFLNVVILRYGTKTSALTGRSKCPKCKHALEAWELIPVVSFLLLRGRCRTCNKQISWRYPVVELMTAILTALILVYFGAMFSTIFLWLALWAGIAILWIDLDQMLIPDQAVWLMLLAGIGFRLTLTPISQSLISGFWGLIAGGGFFLLLIILTKGRGMGLGDVKLAAVLGMILGWPNIGVGIFLSVVIGAIIGIVLILTRFRAWRDAIPFAPFLLIGATLAMIWGEQLISFYLGF